MQNFRRAAQLVASRVSKSANHSMKALLAASVIATGLYATTPARSQSYNNGQYAGQAQDVGGFQTIGHLGDGSPLVLGPDQGTYGVGSDGDLVPVVQYNNYGAVLEEAQGGPYTLVASSGRFPVEYRGTDDNGNPIFVPSDPTPDYGPQPPPPPPVGYYAALAVIPAAFLFANFYWIGGDYHHNHWHYGYWDHGNSHNWDVEKTKYVTVNNNYFNNVRVTQNKNNWRYRADNAHQQYMQKHGPNDQNGSFGNQHTNQTWGQGSNKHKNKGGNTWSNDNLNNGGPATNDDWRNRNNNLQTNNGKKWKPKQNTPSQGQQPNYNQGYGSQGQGNNTWSKNNGQWNGQSGNPLGNPQYVKPKNKNGQWQGEQQQWKPKQQQQQWQQPKPPKQHQQNDGNNCKIKHGQLACH